ncbi:MAG TPA: CBS domain-containing protein [Gaiellaceae bacterium]|nr:CBS domain-containing protein [Gaiellaceae bacterium]
MKVEDVMTENVRTVTTDTPLKEVAEILAEQRISGLPVVEAGRVVGVVSEADILAKERGEVPRRGGLLGLLLEDGLEARAKLDAETAGEAMTSPAITIRRGRSLVEAAAKMIDAQVNRLPVVDDNDELVGIVTRADLVRAFVRSDADIAREIREDVILHTLWIVPDELTITVDNGAVTLGGEVETKSDAELLPEFVRRVPGVISVDSRLTWRVEENRPSRRRKA